ncbi:MAG: winged helix-turn-helix transcriptional regulator [Anaerolineae bacterium]|nr:winged helix-turn-helix transcriptional regulator [Anaerolineae bacterium]
MTNQSSTPRPDKDTWRELKNLRDYFRALSDVIRLEIIRQLARTEEISVSQLADILHLSQPLVSWHLSRLKKAGLIQVRRQGRESHYSLVWQKIQQSQREFIQLLGAPAQQEPGKASQTRPSGVLHPLTGDWDEGEAWA